MTALHGVFCLLSSGRNVLIFSCSKQTYVFSLQSVVWCSDMSSIVTLVFNTTIGWLVNKGRDMTAERLKEGDVADQKIRDLIVREVEDIKSKLDGLSRKDLLAAVDSFKTGIRYFFEAFDVRPSSQASVGIADENLSEHDLDRRGNEDCFCRRGNEKVGRNGFQRNGEKQLFASQKEIRNGSSKSYRGLQQRRSEDL